MFILYLPLVIFSFSAKLSGFEHERPALFCTILIYVLIFSRKQTVSVSLMFTVCHKCDSKFLLTNECDVKLFGLPLHVHLLILYSVYVVV